MKLIKIIDLNFNLFTFCFCFSFLFILPMKTDSQILSPLQTPENFHDPTFLPHFQVSPFQQSFSIHFPCIPFHLIPPVPFPTQPQSPFEIYSISPFKRDPRNLLVTHPSLLHSHSVSINCNIVIFYFIVSIHSLVRHNMFLCLGYLTQDIFPNFIHLPAHFMMLLFLIAQQYSFV